MAQPHPHDHPHGIIRTIAEALHLPGFGHSHEHGYAELAGDVALQDNQRGIRTIWLALLALTITTVLQIAIFVVSNSVALLADTVHNLGDALNSVPLLAAFYLARRPATRRYTYGFGRAEDVAGILIVVSIAFSAGYILVESLNKLFNPQPLANLPWVALAAVVGFIGNELVAVLQIRVGKDIGSAAMIADGQHARVDGITSLAVLVAVFGTLIGLPILDPIVGIVIGVAIVGITWNATKSVWYRLMDAVDPKLINQLEQYASEVAGVVQVVQLQARWIGHRLYAEITLAVNDSLSLAEANSISSNVENVLRQAMPLLGEVTIHVAPQYESQPKNDVAAPVQSLLPPRYQLKTPSAAPMGAADLKIAADGSVAWNDIWTDFCDLALAGGPPHRGTLLEAVDPAVVNSDPEGYERTLQELERGLRMVSGLPVIRSQSPGWIGVECDSEDMALWLLRAIVVENVSIRREDRILYLPASPEFRLEREIKNVITVVAKTTHYWREHAQSFEQG